MNRLKIKIALTPMYAILFFVFFTLFSKAFNLDYSTKKQ